MWTIKIFWGNLTLSVKTSRPRSRRRILPEYSATNSLTVFCCCFFFNNKALNFYKIHVTEFPMWNFCRQKTLRGLLLFIKSEFMSRRSRVKWKRSAGRATENRPVSHAFCRLQPRHAPCVNSLFLTPRGSCCIF